MAVEKTCEKCAVRLLCDGELRAAQDSHKAEDNCIRRRRPAGGGSAECYYNNP